MSSGIVRFLVAFGKPYVHWIQHRDQSSVEASCQWNELSTIYYTVDRNTTDIDDPWPHDGVFVFDEKSKKLKRITVNPKDVPGIDLGLAIALSTNELTPGPVLWELAKHSFGDEDSSIQFNLLKRHNIPDDLLVFLAKQVNGELTDTLLERDVISNKVWDALASNKGRGALYTLAISTRTPLRTLRKLKAITSQYIIQDPVTGKKKFADNISELQRELYHAVDRAMERNLPEGSEAE